MTTEQIKQELQEKITQGFIPYAMGWKDNIKSLKQKPFGIELLQIDVSKSENKKFFELYLVANGLAFGGKDMGMPAWVALDCVALPTTSIGLALPAEKLSEKLKKEFELEAGYEGLVPITMYNALPAYHNKKTFINFTICSLMPNGGLGKLTTALAIEAYDADTIKSIIQYDSYAIKLHSKLGNLSVESAQVPVHTMGEMTLVYTVDVKNKEALYTNMCMACDTEKVKKKATFLLDPNDLKTKQAMQQNIEKGKVKYTILKPGLIECEGKMLVPILEEKT